MKTLHICPVCAGRCLVPSGFYSTTITSSTIPEKCRSCNGTGYIVIEEQE